MTRARTNANVTAAVGRNMIINGAMNVAQRSASVTGLGASTTGYHTVDRFALESSSSNAGVLTMTQTADGPNGISANCTKLDCTTADTSIASAEYLLFRQRFEGQNIQRFGKGVAGAKQTTVSFYVKASAAFTFGCELRDHDNGRQITKLFDVTTAWNRIELTFPADVDDGSSPFADDNALSLDVAFWLHAGATYTGAALNTAAWADTVTNKRAAGIDSFFSNTANNFFITGVQMEIGPVATEFEQEEISVTLDKCQRYFERILTLDAYGFFGSGTAYDADTATVGVIYKTKRAEPTLAFSATSHFTVQHGSTNMDPAQFSGIQYGLDRALVDANGSGGLTTGLAIILISKNTTSAYIDVKAEL